MPKLTVDIHLLQAALIGYEAEKARVTAAIKQIEERLGKRPKGTTPGSAHFPHVQERPTRLSAAARQRIVDAQKKRWSEYRRRQATPI